jgi:creatinine amidohydrolase
VTRLDRAPWPDVSRRAEEHEILLVPVGATEQHGPHLPLTTDTDIAEAIVGGAAARHGHLLVAPALAYGSSGEHQDFTGTISIGQEATELVLVELGRSAGTDFAHVIVVSAHGGNAVPLARAMERLADEGQPVTAWSPAWRGDLHAGRTETSLMLAIAPDRVAIDRAEAGDPRPISDLLPILRDRGVRSVCGNGVLGDPAGATVEEGRRLLDVAIDDLVGTAVRLGGRPATGFEVAG